MENILVIELQPHDSVGIAGGRILTHRCIAVHSIDLLAIRNERDLQVVQERGVGAPQFHIRRHRDLHRNAVHRLRPGNLFSSVQHGHLYHIGNLRGSGVDLHAQGLPVDIGRGANPGDVLRRHRFEPYGLPNPADGRIHDAAGVVHLLTARLVTGVGRIPDFYLQRIGSFLIQRGGNIECKRGITARMPTDLDVVDPYVRFPVHGSEMQQHPLPGPFSWHGELARIP